MLCSFCGKEHEGKCPERNRVMNKTTKTNLRKTDKDLCAICQEKPHIFVSKKYGPMCSDSCYEIAQRGEDLTVPRIVKNRQGDLHFMQGEIRFPVSYDLVETLGISQHGMKPPSCLNKLMDSQVVILAGLNNLPVDPFVRELVESPLRGLIQLQWYRDLNIPHDDVYLLSAQERRVREYIRNLREYRPGQGGEKKRITEKEQTWHKMFKTKTGHFKLSSGRERQLFEVIYNLSQKGKNSVPFPQIVEGAKGKVKTKQNIEKITLRFLKVLIKNGSVEEVK